MQTNAIYRHVPVSVCCILESNSTMYAHLHRPLHPMLTPVSPWVRSVDASGGYASDLIPYSLFGYHLDNRLNFVCS
jgi:hypothetical protein